MTEPTPTSEESKKINAINKQTIHQICSGQVVLDLSTALKELVENSLDSGATLINITLKDYGKTCISVSDNGNGVLEQDFEGLGLKHHTSKLREFSDLTEVSTFGFRGEALSSLSSLANLSIVTRHATSKHGFKLEFDHNGILQKKEPCAREVGTTVHVKNIFKYLPVRAKEFERNLKKEYARAIQMLYSYCLVSTNTKIACSNSVSGKAPNVVVNTASSSNILNNINTVFGKKSLNGIEKLELLPPDEATLHEYNLPKDTVVDFEWDCYISSCDHDVGRSTSDRQFFYVNGRPCDLASVSKLINHIYHRYNNKQYPFVYLNLMLNKQSTDINVTPNKRVIFCIQERLILATLKFSLTTTWDKLQGNFTVKSISEQNFGLKRVISPTSVDRPLKRFHNLNVSNTESIEEEDIQSDDEDKIIQCDNDDVQSNITQQVKILNNTEMSISLSIIRQKLQEKQNASPSCAIPSTKIKFKVQMEANTNSMAEGELKKQLTKDSFLKGKWHNWNEDKEETEEVKIIQLTVIQKGKDKLKRAESGHRVELTGIPVSGYWQFGQEDIEELIFLIKEGGIENKENNIYRPSRVRQMLASRACRSAVMIGTALNNNDMQKLITQMAQMNNPWSCPHGRPTIRHLLSLNLIHK
ncbi:Mismatch repair endonuclease PMS2 [Anthophora retusa]